MNFTTISSLKLISHENVGSLSDAFADYLELTMVKSLSSRFNKPYGLATGRTMEPIYRALILRLKKWPSYKLERLLDGWISFNLDEYIGLDPSDNSSFRSYMNDNFAKPIGLNPNKLRIPDCLALDPAKEAENYSSELLSFGGLGIQILGLGINGHIGFNEPPSAKEDKCRVVSLSDETRQQNSFSFANNTRNVPSQAITLGLKEILGSEEIHLVVTGFSKANILYKLLTSPCSEDLPASFLAGHENVFLWADKLALTKVNERQVLK